MELKDEVRGLRERTGMSRQEFARYFEVPYRTLQDWELGNRRMPEHLLRLIEYRMRDKKESSFTITCKTAS